MRHESRMSVAIGMLVMGGWWGAVVGSGRAEPSVEVPARSNVPATACQREQRAVRPRE